MPSSTALQDTLRLGLTIVSEQWHYKAKDWVTSVHAADIDDDGNIEIILGSRDGRVHSLTREGDLRWQRIVGNKTWVGSLATVALPGRSHQGSRIIVGTRDGFLYVVDKDGKILSKDGRAYIYEKDGRPDDAEKAAFWYSTSQTIRQIYASPERTTEIIFGSEDRSVYALDARTGALRWQFQTGGRVRALCSCDINDDGALETLVGSGDKYLYVLDTNGQCIDQRNIERQIHAICASDVDQDGNIEILIATDRKDLSALHPDLTPKWCRLFGHRFHSLCVADLDNDGNLEIVAGSEDKHLYILDHQGRLIWRHHLGQRIFSVYAHDIDHDGRCEVIVGCDDSRVHILHINLIKGLDRKIRRSYQSLGRPPLSDLTDFSQAQRALLADILVENNGLPSSSVSLKQVENLYETHDYLQALQQALRLQRQQVQLLWHKDDIGHVRSLCFGDISGDPKLEVIIGTDRGSIQAYTAFGRQLWSHTPGDQPDSPQAGLLAIQTGYLNHDRWANIVAASTDHHLYLISGVTPVSGTKQHKNTPLTVGKHFIDEWMSTIHVDAPTRYAPTEVIVGTEDKKIHIYRNSLDTPTTTITTPQGIKILSTLPPQKDGSPEIIAGSLGNQVYAYTRSGDLLWTYETRYSVQALSMRDIDNDGNIEVIVGSEDRNVHVLDDQGQLIWRYYLPDRVLAVEAADIDGDQHLEILAGCADGHLYVFNNEGDLLWQYQSNDRIRAIRVADINEDTYVEVVVGSEDRLEVLQMLDQRHLSSLITQCWQALQQDTSADTLLLQLLQHTDPALRAYAISIFIQQSDFTAQDCALLEESLRKESAPEVRQAFIRPLINRYSLNPSKIHALLNLLVMDPEQVVKIAFLTHLPLLMKHDPNAVWEYLSRLSRNLDRLVRRTAVRTVHHLLTLPSRRVSPLKETGTSNESSTPSRRVAPLARAAGHPCGTGNDPGARRGHLFDLLLTFALDKESIWVQQEAARPLALFLDINHADLVTYLHLLVVKGVSPHILLQISQHARTTLVQHVLRGLVLLLDGLHDDNVQERLEQAVLALEEARSLRHGQELWLSYHELRHLWGLPTLDTIAQYQSTLSQHQAPLNAHFSVVLRILQQLNSITRKLNIYLSRQGLDDRLSGLLEASSTITAMHTFVDREYEARILGEPIHRLPDHHLFLLLLTRWQAMLQARLSELRGKAELTAELKTKQARHEEQVGIVLVVSNKGRSSANNVKVTLLHSHEFEIVGQHSFEIETIVAHEEVPLEFVIRPHNHSANLLFEVAYTDVEPAMQIVLLGDRLELQVSQQQDFTFIPNPYSTGTPTHDSAMFYGREQDMAFLKDNLGRTSAKTIVILYGQRRSGKTTLLHHLANTSILAEHIPILIDMQHHAYLFTINKFFRNISLRIHKELDKRGITIDSPHLQAFETDPTFAFELFLDDVEAHLTHQRIILLIDEFEVLEDLVLKQKLDPEIFGYIRSLMQHRPHLNFLLAGTHQIEQLIKGYWSVFFNIALHYHLGHLSEQGARALITKPVEGTLTYEPHALHKIRQLTADQPYLIHLLCRSLVDHCNEQRKNYATINDVNAVLHEVMESGQFHFSWIWDTIQSAERITLSMLAHSSTEEHQRISLSEIEELYKHYHLPSKREQLTVHLKALIDADIIENVSDHTPDRALAHYRIPVGLIRQWLRKEKPIELVLREEITH